MKDIDFALYRIEKPEVYARKCPECGTLYYPVPMICRHCAARRDPSGMLFSSWEKVPLSGLEGKLLTWTRVYALPADFTERYLLFGIVELSNGLRASGRLLVEEPVTGMKLVAKAAVVREKVGRDVFGFVFDRV
jgi:uncharacterized OB-fold protein